MKKSFLSSNLFQSSVLPLFKGALDSEKQTASHRSCFPLKKGQEIFQVYAVPFITREATSTGSLLKLSPFEKWKQMGIFEKIAFLRRWSEIPDSFIYFYFVFKRTNCILHILQLPNACCLVKQCAEWESCMCLVRCRILILEINKRQFPSQLIKL